MPFYFKRKSSLRNPPAKSKRLLWKTKFSPQPLFLFALVTFFAFAKNGIAHFAMGLRSLCSRSSSLRSLSTPVGDAIFLLKFLNLPHFFPVFVAFGIFQCYIVP